MSGYISESKRIGFVPYTHDDDIDMLICWQDRDTQKGYNHAFCGSLNDLRLIEIGAFPFWVVVVDKSSGEKVGVLRLSCGEAKDLAIWIYPNHRGKGYGTEAFSLAVEYISTRLNLQMIYASCYCNNIASMRMLEKVGFIRYPDGDQQEKDCFTGEPITQLSYKMPISQRMDDFKQILNDAWNLFDSGNFLGAEELYKKCYEQIGMIEVETFNAIIMGLIYTETFLGKFEEARKYGIILLNEAQNDEDKHVAIHQLGMVERMAGNYAAAMSLFVEENGLIINSFPGDKLKMSANLYEQGYVAMKMQNYEHAKYAMNMSLECAIEAKDDMCIGCAFRGMGEIMHALEKTEYAIDYFKKALSAFTDAGDSFAVEEIQVVLNEIQG